MYRLRSKSGDESVFRTPEEIRSALLSGIATPDAQIWDSVLKGWVPLLEHALYKQIAAAPADRKSGASRVSGATPPPTPKPAPKLVIKRPGDAGTKAMPAVKPPVGPPKAAAPATPAAPPKTPSPLDDLPELDLVDLDLSVDGPAAPPPPPPRKTPPPAPAPTPPARTTPAPQPSIAEAPTKRVSSPRVSGPSAPVITDGPVPMRHTAETVAQSGSKKGLIIAGIVVVALGGGAFAMLSGKGQEATVVDSAAIVAPTVDSTVRDSSAAVADSAARPDSTRASDSTVAAAPVAPVTAPAADTTTVATGGEAVPFAPIVERGPVPWTAVVLPPPPAIGGGVEGVRARYLAAQARALATYEAGLEVAGFQRMFDPARAGREDRRNASLEAVDGARSALRDFRRRQASIDFAYSDTLRQSGADDPNIRSLGPALRETPAQLALTDSLLGAVGEMYGILINEAGGYTITAGQIRWRDADNAARYRVLQERLTAQYGRLRSRPPADIPPAMLGILRGIGLPR
jgi:hypothetical protein